MSQAGALNAGGGSDSNSFVTDSGTAVPVAGVINIKGQQAGTVPVVSTNGSGNTVRIEDRTWLTQYVVDPSATVGLRGTFQTIGAALTAASSGSNIFIRPGTYTENITLKAGVNLIAFAVDEDIPTVTIVGNATAPASGSVSLSNIRLQTNSSNFLTASGTSSPIVYLNNCFLNCTNNTGISFTTSSASAQIYLTDCTGDVGTTGISLFTHASNGLMNFEYCDFTNTGSSTTPSTLTGGVLIFRYTRITVPIATTSTAILDSEYSQHDTSATNTTAITHGGGATSSLRNALVQSGSASAISISSQLFVIEATVNSSNTNAITGAGTILYEPIFFTNNSSTINTTTQTPLVFGPLVRSNTFVPSYVETAVSYSVLTTDYYVSVTSTASARTVTLPATGLVTGQSFVIKDASGAAATNNITITVSGGAINIDGTTTKAIDTNYGSITVTWNGSKYYAS